LYGGFERRRVDSEVCLRDGAFEEFIGARDRLGRARVRRMFGVGKFLAERRGSASVQPTAIGMSERQAAR
jgi:hypothetical protein